MIWREKIDTKKIETSEASGKKVDIANETLKCEKWDFTPVSKKGLKTHQKRKHTMPIQDKLIISCERCENKFEHVKDLQNHMRCHTQAKYLCD